MCRQDRYSSAQPDERQTAQGQTVQIHEEKTKKETV